MAENSVAVDFLSLLPLTLILTDYAGTEKIADLPRELSTKSAPSGTKPSSGDITFYAPWGNLAVFYRDFPYASGLIPLAKLDDDAKWLKGLGPLEVTIEAVSGNQNQS